MKIKALAIYIKHDTNKMSEEEYLALINSADFTIVESLTLSVKDIHPGTYITKGKLEYIKEQLTNTTTIIISTDLSGIQVNNLEIYFECKVLDKTDLLLSIFNSRAKTKQAKLQVELSSLIHKLPRLTKQDYNFNRQYGKGINRGVGEKKLELEKRVIKTRISKIKKELEKLSNTRSTQRKTRLKGQLPLVSLMGYTNVGKSSIMNCLLNYSLHHDKKNVISKDNLFETLDSAIRKILTPKINFLLSDTVGFIHDLPPLLLESFKSTLEELNYADLILLVVDSSDPELEEQLLASTFILDELELNDTPLLLIYNKADLTDYTYPLLKNNTLYMSTIDYISIELLINTIRIKLDKGEFNETVY